MDDTLGKELGLNLAINNTQMKRKNYKDRDDMFDSKGGLTKKGWEAVSRRIASMKSKDGQVHIDRLIFQKPEYRARELFLELIRQFEQTAKKKYSEITKIELTHYLLKLIEEEKALCKLRSDSKEFVFSRIVEGIPLMLYLFMLICPTVTNYTITGETLEFINPYTQQNFAEILRRAGILWQSIMYDAVLKVIEKKIGKSISILKFKIDWSWDRLQIDSDDIEQIIENALKVESKHKTKCKLLRKYRPNLIAYAVHYKALRENKTFTKTANNSKELVSFFNPKLFYAKSKELPALDALTPAYSAFLKAIEKQRLTFYKVLCCHHFNKHTNLFYVHMMNELPEYKPYMIDGFLTAHTLFRIIKKNNAELLCSMKNHADSYELTAVFNSPNYIIGSMRSYDYEFLNYLIDRISKTIEAYYLPDEKNTDEKLRYFILQVIRDMNWNIKNTWKNQCKINHLPKRIDIEPKKVREILSYQSFSEALSLIREQ